MSPVVTAVLVAVAVAALYFIVNPSLAFADAGNGGGDTGATSADGSGTPPPSGRASQFDPLIAQAASAAGIDPVLLKAICAEESGFNPDSINPESDFTLNGVSYTQNDPAGRRLLVAWIKQGNDPASIGLNPSCGIAQVRVSNAKKFIAGLSPWDLFDAGTCLEAAAYLIADDGTTVDTADIYNVGHGLNWLRGVRNIPYRTKVQGYYAQFLGDFQ
jgi:hypothetical protein